MNGKKTYLVVIAMILHALTSYALGYDVTLNLQEIFGALGLAALRHGVANSGKSNSLAPGMNLLFLCGLCALCVSPVRAQDEVGPDFDWVAPVPALPDTEWYDYGWDSTSNGPTPAELAQRAAARAPLRPAGNAAVAKDAATNAATRELATVTLTYAETRPGRFYADSGLTLATRHFDDVQYGYGLRLGYQVSRHWGVDVGVGHTGLDVTGSAIQDLSFRAVARLPFELFSPYTFLGGRFDLERDRWTIEPGAGIELGADRLLRGLSIYAEGKLKATTDGQNSYGFETGVRLRF